MPDIQPNVNRAVSLITGGGSGIGRVVAVRLVKGSWGRVDERSNGPEEKFL